MPPCRRTASQQRPACRGTCGQTIQAHAPREQRRPEAGPRIRKCEHCTRAASGGWHGGFQEDIQASVGRE